MRIGVPQETAPGERRVALVPESCKKLVQAGYEVAIEAGAGVDAGYADAAYREAGAAVESERAALVGSSDLLLKVGPPARDEVGWLRAGAIYLGSLMPLRNTAAVRALADRRITSFSTDAIPRTTRAQSMDTLSSMANIAGYKGVLLAAAELNKYFPMFMTAAGMVPPAKVFVIGAGVAGLQAIATAKRLGAHVTATDVRPEVKEQIESVGGKYVGIELAESAAAGGGYAKELSEEDKARQREILAAQCAQVDVVVTTALIGGVFAPRLITATMVECDAARGGDRGPRGRGWRELRALAPGRNGAGEWRDDPRPAQSPLVHAPARESPLFPEPHRLRAGVHQGQGLQPRPRGRHPAGRADHPRRRGAARPHP